MPTKAPVAGIAMGLVKEEERFAVLTDILGDEDHLGDMDFKVAGTAEGVTALQMDIKIEGITEEIMEIALNQAREGIQHILGEMSKAIETSREQVSENAPQYLTVKIDPDKIRDVIGKGATIRSLCEETKALLISMTMELCAYTAKIRRLARLRTTKLWLLQRCLKLVNIMRVRLYESSTLVLS